MDPDMEAKRRMKKHYIMLITEFWFQRSLNCTRTPSLVRMEIEESLAASLTEEEEEEEAVACTRVYLWLT